MAEARSLARVSLDRRLGAWRDLGSHAARPRGGWIRALRDALGMSSGDLAERLGVDQSTVTRLEQSERERRVQLDTLDRVAAALDCEVVYALVPRRTLEEVVHTQARQRAVEEISRVNHSMGLEAQSAYDDADEDRVQALTEQFQTRRDLWRSGVGPRDSS